jgi:hypothetical protein
MRYTATIFLAVAACLFCSFTATYFSWAGIAYNQTVSWNNANDGVSNGYFAARGTPPTGYKQITKAEALANYWWSPYNATLWDKSNNQLVVKQDMTPGDVLSASDPLYYRDQASHTVYGWANPCAVGTTFSVTAYYQPALAVNTKLYSNVNYGILFTDGPLNTDWFSLNGTPVKLDTYASYPELYRYVTAIGSCQSLAYITQSTTSTLRISGFSPAAACSDVIYLTGEYVALSDGLTYTWNTAYNIVAGNTSHPDQTPISDLTGLPLVSGDQISKINGGSSLTFYICTGTTYVILANPLP